MGFLIRCAFWLSLVLLFIPFGTSGEAQDVEPIGPLQALAATRDTVRDIANICTRQPDACATARAAVHTISARAKEGMRIAQELIEDQDTRSAGAKPLEEATPDAETGPTGNIASTQ